MRLPRLTFLMTSQTRPVKTTKTSLTILREIRDNNGLTLTDLAKQLGLAKSTVHNHLATLTDEGFLIREGNTYHISLRFMAYGEHARTRKTVYTAARTYVYELAKRTNKEVDFIVPENGQVYTLEYALGDTSPSRSPNLSPLQAGNTFHMHNCASGKAILAEYPQERVQEIIDHWGLPATTEQTITDEDVLFAELDTIRGRGYAINDEELIEGFHAIGAVVTDATDTVVGAVTIGGPTYWLSDDELLQENTIHQLRETIATLEADVF